MRHGPWPIWVPALAATLIIGIVIGRNVPSPGPTEKETPPATDQDIKDLNKDEVQPEPKPKPKPKPQSMATFLNQYLGKKSSPMATSGTEFVSHANSFGVDPRLVVAISGAESSFGRKICGPYNAWNWFHCYASGTCSGHPCQNSPFTSWERGARTVTKFLKRSYLNKGYVTLELIGAKYCAEGCEHWLPNVKKFYAGDLGGSVGDLTWPIKPAGPA